MTDLVSGVFSDDEFVLATLQAQMQAKVSRLVEASSLSKEEISKKSGIEPARLDALLEGIEKISPFDLTKIINAVAYFNQES